MIVRVSDARTSLSLRNGLGTMRSIFGAGVRIELEHLAETGPELVRCLVEVDATPPHRTNDGTLA
jgi:hypothetical protein